MGELKLKIIKLGEPNVHLNLKELVIIHNMYPTSSKLVCVNLILF